MYKIPALIISDCLDEFQDRVKRSFDNYTTLGLSNANTKRLYEEAHQVRIASSYNPIFLLFQNPVLAIIVTAHLMEFLSYANMYWKKVYVIHWADERFHVLEVP